MKTKRAEVGLLIGLSFCFHLACAPPPVPDEIRAKNVILFIGDGLGTAQMALGLNYPMGPLALADFIGLDTLLFIANGIHDKLPEEQYAAPALLQKMVADSLLGRKSGRGFYEY